MCWARRKKKTEAMKIKGFQGTSLLDYPGKIASLVFFGGCNLTCPFCHNPALVLSPEEYPDIPLEELIDEFKERRKFIDGVVVSGGEPTVDRDLLSFLREVKSLGLLVKLDTNGLAPKVLEKAMTEGLVDSVAMDLKTSPERYGELHSAPVNLNALPTSVRLIMEGNVDYEFRTTCVPGFVEERDIRQIGEMARGAKYWVLQQFVPGHAMAETMRELTPHPASKIRAFEEMAREYAEEVSVRGL